MSLGSDESENEVLPPACVFLGPPGRPGPISLLSSDSDSEAEAPPALCERLRWRSGAQSSTVPTSPARRAPASVFISGQVEEESWTEEPNVLLLLHTEEFASMIYNYRQALVDLQLHTGIQVRCLENWKDLSDFASMFTKSVAEAPFKRERENTGFSFYLENEWCRGVKVDRSGKGLLQVWQRQIQQFHRVSPDMASAIVSAYPSPWLLKQAYHRCFSEQEQQNILADIPVRRGDGVTATSRRIGPELSRRIFLQMTSHNPDLCLDVTN
uniref:Essential meiotic structure-specific endonuclease 1 n=1 Tax=Crocodylus porosus TaxID=8502 RepID=A0A7M4E2D3_CROPO